MQIFFQTPLSSFVMSLFVCVFCCGFTVIFASIISAYCRVLLELLLRAHAIIGSLINPVLLLGVEIARSLAQKLARKNHGARSLYCCVALAWKSQSLASHVQKAASCVLYGKPGSWAAKRPVRWACPTWKYNTRKVYMASDLYVCIWKGLLCGCSLIEKKKCDWDGRFSNQDIIRFQGGSREPTVSNPNIDDLLFVCTGACVLVSSCIDRSSVPGYPKLCTHLHSSRSEQLISIIVRPFM